MNREEQLQRTLWEIDRKWGQGTMRPAVTTTSRRAISTGFDGLDHALHAGGFAVHQVNVVMGVPTSGATTCAYRAIAGVQKLASVAAWFDFSTTFDPDAAVRYGVELPHLLLVRTPDIDDGLQVARDIILTNAVTLLVIDLCACAVTLSQQLWRRLADVTLRSDCTVMILTDRDDPALDTTSHTWLTFERQAWLKAGDRIVGCKSQVTIRKDKPTVKTLLVPLDIHFGAAS
jgi:hypothetical protein